MILVGEDDNATELKQIMAMACRVSAIESTSRAAHPEGYPWRYNEDLVALATLRVT